MLATHPILRKIACVTMGLALFLVVGGHMALLQGVAWATMVHDFSRAGSLSQAVNKTFDGKHLCPLCKKIAKARTAEQNSPTSVKAEKKAEVFVAQAASEIAPPCHRPFFYHMAPLAMIPERFDAPSVPVPRQNA